MEGSKWKDEGVVTPIRDIVAVMMLSLRRRYLEQQIGKPFDSAVSLELDAVIVEQERHRGEPIDRWER